MQTLTYPTSNFDATADFKVAGVGGACYLFCAAEHPDYKDGKPDVDFYKIFVMQHASCLKAKYSAADIAALDRFRTLEPIKNGDEVEVAGKRYTVRVLGNYSDAGYLVPVES